MQFVRWLIFLISLAKINDFWVLHVYSYLILYPLDIFISHNTVIHNPVLVLIRNWCFILHVADYCFSNGYINSIISHPYKFVGGDLAPYYVSFLRLSSFPPPICVSLSFSNFYCKFPLLVGGNMLLYLLPSSFPLLSFIYLFILLAA